MAFLDKLKNLVRFSQVTGAANNEVDYPVQQMTFKRKVVNVLQLFPYGLYSNVSSNDSLGVMFSIDGSENNRAALSYTPQLRPKDLEQNELAIYHPYTNSFIKFRNNGNLEVDTIQGETLGNIIINCENATINANQDITANCTNAKLTASAAVDVDCADATIVASSAATVDSPSTTITGTLQVNGAISTDSSVTAQGEVTGNGVALSTHQHSGSPTAPTGAVSNTGAPV